MIHAIGFRYEIWQSFKGSPATLYTARCANRQEAHEKKTQLEARFPNHTFSIRTAPNHPK